MLSPTQDQASNAWQWQTPSTQGKSILPWHSGSLCLSFPQSQGEGGWLGAVRLPTRLQPSPSQLYGEMAALLGEELQQGAAAAAWQHTPSTGPQEKGIIFSVVSKEMRLW